MGVWERSPAGVRLALDTPEQVASFRAALPDLDDADVIGSAYCIRRYEVDARFGGRAGLAAARAALAERGVRLLVDFVPNHVAPDHPWLTDHPEYFVQGTADDLADDPAGFLAVGDTVIARGRDPYFPPWPDVAQLNAFAPGLRQAAADTLIDIGEQADGVRCDMAMLLLNDVFARTWGERAGAAAGAGVLDRGDRRGPRRPPGLPVRRRGVLGPGVGAPAARVRLLLRQAPLRPAAPRGRRRGARPPRRRPRLPDAASCASSRTTTNRAPPPSSHRPQERAAAVVIATLPGRHAVARGPVRGLAGAPAGVPRPPTGRAGRRGAARLPPPSCSPPPPQVRQGDGSCARRAAGPTTTATSSSLAWWWIGRRAPIARRRQPRRRAGRRPHPAAVARPRRAEPGASRTSSPETCSNATATRPPPRASTSTCRPGGRTSWPGHLASDWAVHRRRRFRPAPLARGR